MADYAKMKNADLEALLKDRSLPHTGKKAELVARLVEDDKAKSSSQPPAKQDDEINWDEDTAPAAATSEPAAAAIAAGGTERVKNPAAVPNQVPAIDPAATSDLTAQKDESATTVTATTADPAAPAAPAIDFTSGLPTTDVDTELEKRRKRAAKFGLPLPESTSKPGEADSQSAEAIKALERAKRFGIATSESSDKATGGAGVMSRLDGALPERGPRRGNKRGSDAMLDADALEDAGLKKRRGGGREQRNGAGKGPGAASTEATKKTQNGGGGGSWMSEADRAKAEARKAKWATPASTS